MTGQSGIIGITGDAYAYRCIDTYTPGICTVPMWPPSPKKNDEVSAKRHGTQHHMPMQEPKGQPDKVDLWAPQVSWAFWSSSCVCDLFSPPCTHVRIAVYIFNWCPHLQEPRGRRDKAASRATRAST